MNKKIHFIRANKTKFGGAEKYLTRLSNALMKKNIDHQIINSIFPKFLPSWLRAILFNIQVSVMKGDKLYFSLDRISCPTFYRAGDGVHKVFLNIEKKSKLNPLHPIYLYLEKICFKRAIKIIAISQMVKDNIIKTYEIEPDKISVIYNGIELKEMNYKKSIDKLSQEFSLNKDNRIILFVGSGYKRKGVEEFLQIISKIDNVHNIKAFVIGKEKNMSYYQNLAKELNIKKRVFFTGPREDVDDFYTISDIFLFPTHYEPFGSVILEAMNLKNVVFTTKQCGASELLNSEFVMQSPDDISVIKKINNLLKNNDMLEMIKEQNRLRSKQFSIEKNTDETLKVIDEIIN
ncbi:glycosyltransferase family 4 protein [Candidatus Pseudothioglobus singularis]|nr:glycosyltransferase family 4 protein [Candidatus Pseudothioglobus singularis]